MISLTVMARLARAIQGHERRCWLPWMAHVKWAMTFCVMVLPSPYSPQSGTLMREDTTAFVKSMAARFPSVAALHADHLQHNFGETLPHVLFGDLTRFIVDAVSDDHDGASPQFREVNELLAFLENAFANSDQSNRSDGITNLIAVSFLEYLMFPNNAGEAAVRELLGPALKTELSAMEAWEPSTKI